MGYSRIILFLFLRLLIKVENERICYPDHAVSERQMAAASRRHETLIQK